MNRFIQMLRNTKLRDRMLFSYLFTCLIPLLLTTTVIHRFSVDNLEEESMELALLYSSQIVTNINNRIDEYDRITKTILVDNDMLSEIVKDENPQISDEINNRLLVRKLLMRMAMMQPDMENIMFLTKGGSFYQYSNGNMSIDRNALEDTQWFQEILEEGKVLTVSPAHFKTYCEPENDEISVTVGRRIYNGAGQEVGLLLIDMNPFELVEMNDVFKATRNDYHIHILVSRKSDGAVLYDSNVVSGEQTWKTVLEREEPLSWDEREYIVISDNAHQGEFLVEAVIPRKELMGKAFSITVLSMAAIGGSVIMIVALSVILSRTITRPITELQKKMERMGEGDYAKVEADVITSDEIGILILHYNHMVEKIQTLINDVYLAEIKQKDAKLMALRTQINPHMLYNTLESIRMKALVKGDAEVAEMIKILAKMFRAALGKEDELNTVRTELEYVENYVKLQNIRFPDSFEYCYEVGEELLDVPVVPLVFQPIVENCIEHGYRGRHEKLRITLKISEVDNNAVSVIFQDNGKGMPQEILMGLKEKIENIDSSQMSAQEDNGSSIGLKNIAERIYLRYGKEYSLKILESGDWGTKIEMRFPKGEKQYV